MLSKRKREPTYKVQCSKKISTEFILKNGHLETIKRWNISDICSTPTEKMALSTSKCHQIKIYTDFVFMYRIRNNQFEVLTKLITDVFNPRAIKLIVK